MVELKVGKERKYLYIINLVAIGKKCIVLCERVAHHIVV